MKFRTKLLILTVAGVTYVAYPKIKPYLSKYVAEFKQAYRDSESEIKQALIAEYPKR